MRRVACARPRNACSASVASTAGSSNVGMVCSRGVGDGHQRGAYGCPGQMLRHSGSAAALNACACWPQSRLVSQEAWMRSEEHTSELQSLMRISYAVFCLKKKKTTHRRKYNQQKNMRQHEHYN